MTTKEEQYKELVRQVGMEVSKILSNYPIEVRANIIVIEAARLVFMDDLNLNMLRDQISNAYQDMVFKTFNGQKGRTN